MRNIYLTGLLCLAATAFAQDVHFDYDRSASFSTYKTYQWVDLKAGASLNHLMDQNIKRSVDDQLIGKGLRRVESGGDLQVSYQASTDKEKQVNGFSMGPRWNAMGQLNTSTIEVGKLVVNFVDPVTRQLVWRGDASKTLDIKKDPDKNYKNLQKSMAKLFRNYPPGAAR